jgi:hypothetical protein
MSILNKIRPSFTTAHFDDGGSAYTGYGGGDYTPPPSASSSSSSSGNDGLAPITVGTPGNSGYEHYDPLTGKTTPISDAAYNVVGNTSGSGSGGLSGLSSLFSGGIGNLLSNPGALTALASLVGGATGLTKSTSTAFNPPALFGSSASGSAAPASASPYGTNATGNPNAYKPRTLSIPTSPSYYTNYGQQSHWTNPFFHARGGLAQCMATGGTPSSTMSSYNGPYFPGYQPLQAPASQVLHLQSPQFSEKQVPDVTLAPESVLSTKHFDLGGSVGGNPATFSMPGAMQPIAMPPGPMQPIANPAGGTAAAPQNTIANPATRQPPMTATQGMPPQAYGATPRGALSGAMPMLDHPMIPRPMMGRMPASGLPIQNHEPFDHQGFADRQMMRASGGEVSPDTDAPPGGLSQTSRYIKGPGDARDDLIDAKLSNNEYVMDGETVAHLGNGSPDEGARKLDEFRENVRKHKGKNLAKGKISPDAHKDARKYLSKE